MSADLAYLCFSLIYYKENKRKEVVSTNLNFLLLEIKKKLHYSTQVRATSIKNRPTELWKYPSRLSQFHHIQRLNILKKYSLLNVNELLSNSIPGLYTKTK